MFPSGDWQIARRLQVSPASKAIDDIFNREELKPLVNVRAVYGDSDALFIARAHMIGPHATLIGCAPNLF